MADMQANTLRRSSMMSMARDAQADVSARAAQISFHPPGPSPSPNSFNAQMTPHFQPVTPAPGGQAMHQTPVPIPHPPHHAASGHQMGGKRPVHYQHQPQPQPGFVPNYPLAYPQSPAAAPHHQPMANPLTGGYSQGHLAPGARVPFTPGGNTAAPHANIYNPPRPPEVYTLPENVNESIAREMREGFQHDSAGRILFFTAPPLDRSHGGLASSSAALGHSVRYLAGREAWLSERTRKRKERDEAETAGAGEKRKNPQDPCLLAEDSVAAQAARALNQWFQHLGQGTLEWRADAGLDGWRKAADASGMA